MSSIVDSLYILNYNPFEFGKYIASFYSVPGNADSNLLLSPLVIPLCSHPVFNETISRAVFGEKKQSSIWTIFNDRTLLYDLQERIDEFQDLTEQCIQYCLINEWLTIDQDSLSLRVCDTSTSSFKIIKSAEKLGLLVRGLSVIEVYAFFGVRPQ